MRHMLSALVKNRPGVLAHISGMFASRGFNIDSLAVGETEDPNLSRITVVVMGDDRHLEQVRKQLEKIVTVVKVVDISREDFVERDLILIKVDVTPERRAEIQGLVEIFRGRVVDVSPEQVMLEISGQERKIEAFIDAVRPYGIRELARTGRIALVRGSSPKLSESGEPPAVAPAAAAPDLINILLPDELQADVYTRDIKPNLRHGDLLLCSHGFNIHFGQVVPPEGVDSALVAPKGPGHLVRSEFAKGGGVPCLIATAANCSPGGKALALAYAKGIGGSRAGGLQTTFAEETETDLFGEPVVLCGCLRALV